MEKRVIKLLTLSEHINDQMGLTVEVEVDGPLKDSGRCTGVFTDYIVTESQNTAHFNQLKLIKEITKNAKDNGLDQNFPEVTQQNNLTFYSQLIAYINLCVTRNGLDEHYGLLTIVNNDNTLMITKEKVKFIPISQIICFHRPISHSTNQSNMDTQNCEIINA